MASAETSASWGLLISTRFLTKQPQEAQKLPGLLWLLPEGLISHGSNVRGLRCLANVCFDFLHHLRRHLPNSVLLRVLGGLLHNLRLGRATDHLFAAAGRINLFALDNLGHDSFLSDRSSAPVCHVCSIRTVGRSLMACPKLGIRYR